MRDSERETGGLGCLQVEGSWYKEFGEVVGFPSGVRPEAVDDGRLPSWPAIA